eukprot:Pgem_evm1s15286
MPRPRNRTNAKPNFTPELIEKAVEALQRPGVTQQEVCDQTGITRTTLRKYVHDKDALAKLKAGGRKKAKVLSDLQIPLPAYPSTLISGQIPPTYLPLDVTR